MLRRLSRRRLLQISIDRLLHRQRCWNLNIPPNKATHVQLDLTISHFLHPSDGLKFYIFHFLTPDDGAVDGQSQLWK